MGPSGECRGGAYLEFRAVRWEFRGLAHAISRFVCRKSVRFELVWNFAHGTFFMRWRFEDTETDRTARNCLFSGQYCVWLRHGLSSVVVTTYDRARMWRGKFTHQLYYSFTLGLT